MTVSLQWRIFLNGMHFVSLLSYLADLPRYLEKCRVKVKTQIRSLDILRLHISLGCVWLLEYVGKTLLSAFLGQRQGWKKIPKMEQNNYGLITIKGH